MDEQGWKKELPKTPHDGWNEPGEDFLKDASQGAVWCFIKIRSNYVLMTNHPCILYFKLYKVNYQCTNYHIVRPSPLRLWWSLATYSLNFSPNNIDYTFKMYNRNSKMLYDIQTIIFLRLVPKSLSTLTTYALNVFTNKINYTFKTYKRLS